MAEREAFTVAGVAMFVVELVVFAIALGSALLGMAGGGVVFVGIGLVLFVLGVFFIKGFVILQPNQAEVLTLFGSYTGTIKNEGWYWRNPLSAGQRLNLRVNNFTTPTLKVNDLDGNPIEIGAVIVWRVVDAARAVFDVQNYVQFVQVQAETALRHLASQYPYDVQLRANAHSLRGSAEEVGSTLQAELQHRLEIAGIEVLEARLSHLAYASEIAGAMLQRQQATAILAARQRIVEGAVLMVEGALKMLRERGVVELTPEAKADVVAKLLVVLTSEKGAQPVLQT